MPRLLLAFLPAMLLLSGCAQFGRPMTPELAKLMPEKPDAAEVEALSMRAARGLMKDPDSVQLRGLTPAKPSFRVGPFGTVEASGMGWFGEVNAKNSFGGYSGFSRFSFFYNGKLVWMFEDDKGWNEVIHYEGAE